MGNFSFKRPPVFILGALAILATIFFVFYFAKVFNLNLTSFLSKKAKPGNCLVLEEKYCQTGKPIYQKGKLVFVGFNLPEKTAIFSPYSGNFSNTPTFFVQKGEEYITYPGISITGNDTIVDKDGKNRPARNFSAVYYNLELTGEPKPSTVEKGAIVGYVSGEKLEAYGDYNLLIGFSRFDVEARMFSTDEEFLKQLFSL